MANSQIQQAPFLYNYNMAVQWASNTTLSIAAGQTRSSDNSTDIYGAASVTLDATVNGVNGLDTGSLANATWYYVYALGSSGLNANADPNAAQDTSDAAYILSTSATAPVLPELYDSYRIIGYALTDGSAHFLKFYTALKGSTKVHYWDSAISVLSAGSATSLTAVSAAAAVPPVDLVDIRLNVQFTPATASDKVSLAVFGSTATTLPSVFGSVAAKVNSAEMHIPGRVDSGASKFLYINSAASGATTIYVVGFVYSV